jgi:hypothetical protein
MFLTTAVGRERADSYRDLRYHRTGCVAVRERVAHTSRHLLVRQPPLCLTLVGRVRIVACRLSRAAGQASTAKTTPIVFNCTFSEIVNGKPALKHKSGLPDLLGLC